MSKGICILGEFDSDNNLLDVSKELVTVAYKMSNSLQEVSVILITSKENM